MAHDWNPHPHQPVDHGQDLSLGPLELDGGSGCFLQQRSCGLNGEVCPALIAEEGKVADQQRLLGGSCGESAADRKGVVPHLIEGHRQGGGMSQGHHRQGVPHQNSICACGFHQGGRETVPGGEDRDRSTVLLLSDQISWTHGLWKPQCSLLASKGLGPCGSDAQIWSGPEGSSHTGCSEQAWIPGHPIPSGRIVGLLLALP